MVKKTEEVEATDLAGKEISLPKPLLIATNFGREDMNELRDAVNYLISRA